MFNFRQVAKIDGRLPVSYPTTNKGLIYVYGYNCQEAGDGLEDTTVQELRSLGYEGGSKTRAADTGPQSSENLNCSVVVVLLLNLLTHSRTDQPRWRARCRTFWTMAARSRWREKSSGRRAGRTRSVAFVLALTAAWT